MSVCLITGDINLDCLAKVRSFWFLHCNMFFLVMRTFKIYSQKLSNI